MASGASVASQGGSLVQDRASSSTFIPTAESGRSERGEERRRGDRKENSTSVVLNGLTLP